jgi:ketol-acid reductoisomerase
MKIGIIGAGQIGSTLTRRLTALGHKVFVANSRGPETLSDLATETGATAVSVPEAVRGVDLIVVTIPQKNIKSSATMAQLATPICPDKDGLGRSHSCSFNHRRRPETFRTAMATAFFWPTNTTSFLPRVTPV